MRRDSLGDALDHWKGSLLESLQNARVLTNLAVDPLASDLPEWNQQDFDLYARLLRVGFHQVLRHKTNIVANRQQYFQEVPCAGDLFIDPDTGVATGMRNGRRYVRPVEIGQLLDKDKKRIVAVYQHVRGKVADRVDDVVSAIDDRIGRFIWSSYESGTVAMLFLSRDCARAAAVSKHFRGILGPHGDERVRQGNSAASQRCEGHILIAHCWRAGGQESTRATSWPACWAVGHIYTAMRDFRLTSVRARTILGAGSGE
jgi:hypothetical protein